MAIDLLQSKIRKLKNPSVIGFSLDPGLIPPPLLQGRTVWEAYGVFSRELLAALKGTVPAVRFSMGSFALEAEPGMTLLKELLQEAKNAGYYVLLDLPALLSPEAAALTAANLNREDCPWQCSGMVLCAYLGSDVIKPFLPLCRQQDKDLFVMVRSANKSAPELQDLLAGGRLVHQAAADLANRLGQEMVGKYGYSRVCAVASASSDGVSRRLRAKYPQMFLLLDGYDYSTGNGKNCAAAFDKLGHGAAACAFSGVTAAWRGEEAPQDYAQAAVRAAQRMRKNLTGYVTVL